MSRSNRSDNVVLALSAASALVFMVTIAFVVVSEQYAKIHQVYSGYQKSADEDRGKAAEKAGRACIGVAPAILTHCIANEINAYDKQQATNKDLQAQQDMALWAFFAALAAFATVGVTGVGVWYVRHTLDATRAAVVEAAKASDAATKAVEITRDTAERQLRAYVGVDSAIKVANREGPGFAVNVIIKNNGQTPAYDFTQWANVALEPMPLPKPFSIYCRERGSVGILQPQGQTLATPIFTREMLPLEEQSIRNNAKAIYVYGEIDYRDAFGAQHHVTFRLRCNGPGLRLGLFKPDGEGNESN